jgi:hypothetical protein
VIRAAAAAKLAGGSFDITLYDHDVYLGPQGWGCGLGQGTLGPSDRAFVALDSRLSLAISGAIHELGHNIGFEHSNARYGTTFQEYGDKSCHMGFSSTQEYQIRKGFNVVQLLRWGVVGASETVVVAGTSSNVGSRLYATYYSTSTANLPRVFRLGTSNYYLAYRSTRHEGVDHQADRSSHSDAASVPTYTGRVLVHFWEPVDAPPAYQDTVTLEGSIGAGETKVFGGYTIKMEWGLNDFCYVSVG